MFLIALSLAEICSCYPTMGGLYFWVCKMKPELPILGCECFAPMSTTYLFFIYFEQFVLVGYIRSRWSLLERPEI